MVPEATFSDVVNADPPVDLEPVLEQWSNPALHAFCVVRLEIGAVSAKVGYEAVDGTRYSVDIGPLPVTDLANMAAYALAESYWQMMAYSYGMNLQTWGTGQLALPAASIY